MQKATKTLYVGEGDLLSMRGIPSFRSTGKKSNVSAKPVVEILQHIPLKRCLNSISKRMTGLETCEIK